MVELDKKNIEQKLFSSDFKFEDSSVFKELMNLYPWCSTFTVVYLKSLSLTNDMRFQKELEEYAVHLNSREIIYDLISASEVSGLQDQTEDVEKVLAVDVNNEKENEVFEPSTESDDSTSLHQDDELNKLIVSNVISDNIINEIENNSKIQDPVKEVKKEVSHEKVETSDVDQSNESPKSFNDWLRQGGQKNNKSNSKEYLTFEKPKTDFFKPQASAKESLAKKNLPVSETLAKVFESQGNYSMAISTYEQLILIFPEKKIFFANQIEQINSKII